jgi:hypothetical protein
MGSLAEERCCFAQGDLHRQVKPFAVSRVHQNGPLASETIVYQKRHNPMLNSAKMNNPAASCEVSKQKPIPTI